MLEPHLPNLSYKCYTVHQNSNRKYNNNETKRERKSPDSFGKSLTFVSCEFGETYTLFELLSVMNS